MTGTKTAREPIKDGSTPLMLPALQDVPVMASITTLPTHESAPKQLNYAIQHGGSRRWGGCRPVRLNFIRPGVRRLHLLSIGVPDLPQLFILLTVVRGERLPARSLAALPRVHPHVPDLVVFSPHLSASLTVSI